MSVERSGSRPPITGLRPPQRPFAAGSQPALRPPTSGIAPEAAGPGGRGWFWLSLSLLIAVSLAVLLLLPDVRKTEPPVSPPQPSVEPIAASDRAAERQEAEHALQALLHQRARLELADAEAWGGGEWELARETVAAADGLFRQGRYSEAARTYAEATRLLGELEGSRLEKLNAALAQAEGMLAENDWTGARSGFQQALRIQPEDPRALEGLAKAGIGERLAQAMQDGVAGERSGDLEAAMAAYRLATEIDAGYPPAVAALERVSTELADRSFGAAMSRALAELEGGRLQAAEQALGDAASVRPGDPALIDLQRRLARMRQGKELERLRAQARDLAQAEDWRGAAERYQQALEHEPNAGFAREGLALAREKIQLHERLDGYLADPEAFYAGQSLVEAEELLAAVGHTPDREPRLREKLTTLRGRVVEARIPLPVILRSDGQTEVTVYHVGRLGRFTERRLELLPGDYTAIGSRIGYRDVRRLIRLRPGKAETLAVDVRCEEPI